MSRKELKIELKNLAVEIRTNKVEMKKYQKDNSGYGGDFHRILYRLKYECRHKHIVYCQLRGRTYEEIESHSRVKPNFDYIKEIMDANKEQVPENVCLGS